MTTITQEKGMLAGFGYEVGRLRFVKRDFSMHGMNSANVAEHTYRVSMLAWAIAEKEGADVGEVLKMALAHDLSEARTLDFGAIPSQYNTANEHKAAEDIMGGALPAGVTAFEAYEARTTLESKIVKDADRLDVVLECRELKFRGMECPTYWDEELLMYRDKFSTETARLFFDEIWNSHPMDWMEPLYRFKMDKIRQNLSHKLKAVA